MARITLEQAETMFDYQETDTLRCGIGIKLWLPNDNDRVVVLENIKKVSKLDIQEKEIKRKGKTVNIKLYGYISSYQQEYDTHKSTLYSFYYSCNTGYLTVTLSNQSILARNENMIKKDIKQVMSKHFNIPDKYLETVDNFIVLTRIDYKRDYYYHNFQEYSLIRQIIDIAPDTIMRDYYNKEIKRDDEQEYRVTYQSTTNRAAEFVLYNKDMEQLRKYQLKKIDDIQLSSYKNMFRSEVRIFNAKLNVEKCKSDGKDKTITNYKCLSSATEYFNKYSKQAFFDKPFYRIDVAKDMVNKSSLKQNMKYKLCHLLELINENGYTKAKEIYKPKMVLNGTEIKVIDDGKPKDDTNFKRHIGRLLDLGISPLTIKTTWLGDNETTYTEIPNFTLAGSCPGKDGYLIVE